MEIWNQAKNFLRAKRETARLDGYAGATVARSTACGKNRPTPARGRLQNETEQQPDAWVHNRDRGRNHL